MNRTLAILGLVLGLALLATAQQNIPDAPSASKPQPAPSQAAPPPATPPVVTSGPRPTHDDKAPARPAGAAGTDAAGQGEADYSSRNELYTIPVIVNQVIIPVTVRNENGYLVEGLRRKDFSVFEDGIEQKVNVFIVDPFPLSAAIVLDVGMSDEAMRKVNDALGALAGAFSEFDEVALYTFGRTTERKLDFSGMTDRLYTTLRRMKQRGTAGGVPVTSGPMGPTGPTINGRPLDPGQPRVVTLPTESSVLNDAILRAAQDLAKRGRERRKIMVVISEGREEGSRASYDEVRKVLLSHEITVYAVGVGEASLPIYRRLETLKVPGLPYGNILPRYAKVTGGEVFPAFSAQALEQVYQRSTEMARNQYTVGYVAKASAAGTYRSIEVRVHRSGLKVQAKDGYYPLPPAR